MRDLNLVLDKPVESGMSQGYGTIAIRVVVLEKSMAATPAARPADEEPLDIQPDEMLPSTGKRPVSSFLEESRRGKQCCVFLINGQRQHAWDNQFIVRDLELKYLRNRMVVVVDCDGLKPEATAALMQGSRNQFYEGQVYDAVASRVIATLKGDPDLRRLEEEAEDEISSLQAGDEAVKAALDQLIEAHHDAAAHIQHGHAQAGGATRDVAAGSLVVSSDVVISGDTSTGEPASDPVLRIRPDVATIRLKPNETRKLTVLAMPDAAWKALEHLSVTFDPPVRELQVTRTSQIIGDDVSLTFAEPEDFDRDEYPIETTLRTMATFKTHPESRMLERRVIINPASKRGQLQPIPLKDVPTFIRVTSRQPIRIIIGGPDVHVRLRWDGKDELLVGNPPPWSFRVSCEAPSVDPPTFLTRPVEGRFELLIQAAVGLKAGEQIKFDVEAVGPGMTLPTAFLVDVVEQSTPRKVLARTSGGAQRRPPYDLLYIKKDQWHEDTCWGNPWSGDDSGSFDEPNANSPLRIFINQDMDLLVNYRESLLEKKHAETTIQQRINKYTAHIAFHLYQMYQNKRQLMTQRDDSSVDNLPSDEGMRDEVRRVARTLLMLMEVTQ